MKWYQNFLFKKLMKLLVMIMYGYYLQKEITSSVNFENYESSSKLQGILFLEK